MLKRTTAAVAVAMITNTALAAPVEFLFTPNKAILLANGTEIVPETDFDEPILAKSLPGYEFEAAEEEGQKVWYVYARKDADGVGQGGINIYLDREKEDIIAEISGGEGVVDATGATTGEQLTEIYKSARAKCGGDFAYACESEISPNIVYIVDAADCGSDVEFADYYTDRQTTKLAPCMKIYSIILTGSESGWRFP